MNVQLHYLGFYLWKRLKNQITTVEAASCDHFGRDRDNLITLTKHAILNLGYASSSQGVCKLVKNNSKEDGNSTLIVVWV
jgi:hypothetical protein